jgi:hypothetical protein
MDRSDQVIHSICLGLIRGGCSLWSYCIDCSALKTNPKFWYHCAGSLPQLVLVIKQVGGKIKPKPGINWWLECFLAKKLQFGTV